MGMSWKLGRVAGIDLYLHPTFFLIFLIPGMTSPGVLPLTLCTFGLVVLHELGHALMARRFGIATEDITIYPIGGVARLQRIPRAPGAELLIALAGPAVNLAIAGVLFGLLMAGVVGPSMAGGSLAFHLLVTNLILAGFNLLPAFPMDGGRVLRALLSGWLGRLQATEIAAGIGRFLAVLFGVYCLFNGPFTLVVLATFIYFAAGSELAQVRHEESRRFARPQSDHGDGEGIWVSPPGYHWVSRGNGVWQLAPIWVRDSGPGYRR